MLILTSSSYYTMITMKMKPFKIELALRKFVLWVWYYGMGEHHCFNVTSTSKIENSTMDLPFMKKDLPYTGFVYGFFSYMGLTHKANSVNQVCHYYASHIDLNQIMAHNMKRRMMWVILKCKLPRHHAWEISFSCEIAFLKRFWIEHHNTWNTFKVLLKSINATDNRENSTEQNSSY